MPTIDIMISMGIGYLFGCIQAAFLIGKLYGKMDIREHGSGNAGASNVTSIMGVKFGAVVGLIDILKGVLAVLVVKMIFPENPELAFLSGLMAIVGHMFPFYMRFRGGKGVAALIGMMFGVQWQLGLIFLLLVIVPALITDYITAGSLTSFVALPVVAFIHEYQLLILLLALSLAALSFFLHRSNLQRIMAGEELKVRATLFKK